ncbi:hypothetical protein KKC32_00625 [Patescibacteria group bacterium]|nr:hypothetical protein [Patescibacteria group bacterium]
MSDSDDTNQSYDPREVDLPDDSGLYEKPNEVGTYDFADENKRLNIFFDKISTAVMHKRKEKVRGTEMTLDFLRGLRTLAQNSGIRICIRLNDKKELPARLNVYEDGLINFFVDEKKKAYFTVACEFNEVQIPITLINFCLASENLEFTLRYPEESF